MGSVPSDTDVAPDATQPLTPAQVSEPDGAASDEVTYQDDVDQECEVEWELTETDFHAWKPVIAPPPASFLALSPAAANTGYPSWQFPHLAFDCKPAFLRVAHTVSAILGDCDITYDVVALTGPRTLCVRPPAVLPEEPLHGVMLHPSCGGEGTPCPAPGMSGLMALDAGAVYNPTAPETERSHGAYSAIPADPCRPADPEACTPAPACCPAPVAYFIPGGESGAVESSDSCLPPAEAAFILAVAASTENQPCFPAGECPSPPSIPGIPVETTLHSRGAWETDPVPTRQRAPFPPAVPLAVEASCNLPADVPPLATHGRGTFPAHDLSEIPLQPADAADSRTAHLGAPVNVPEMRNQETPRATSATVLHALGPTRLSRSHAVARAMPELCGPRRILLAPIDTVCRPLLEPCAAGGSLRAAEVA